MTLFQKLFKPKPKPIPLSTQGQLYNLHEIYTQINEKYFGAKLNLSIDWFGQGTVPKTRILFGSYNHKKKQIRVNRFLDHHSFPKYVIEFIIYHEMLHHIEPPKRGKNGRRKIHHSEFKAKEVEFASYTQAKTFIKSWVKSRQPIRGK